MTNRSETSLLRPGLLALSVGAVSLVFSALCALAVGMWPDQAGYVYGEIMHMDLEGSLRPPNWGFSVFGFSLGLAALAWMAAALYNLMAARF
jgi:hypothetical protein